MTRLLLSALLLVPAAADVPVAAQTALTRAASHYRDGSAHAAAFVQIYTPAGFSTARRESGTVWIQAPQRLRFDYEAPEKKTFTYDAGEGRFYSPEDRQLTVKKLTEEERARLPIVFLTEPAELARRFTIAVEGSGESAPVRLTPREPRPELSWLLLTIAPDGSVRELSYEDGGSNRTDFRFEAWRKEKARPAADYRVAGPKGTRVVESP
jgi:outer membrane lipoprotein-sorting protein